MAVKLYLEKPNEHLSLETYKLAAATDLIWRRLKNRGYAHKHAENVVSLDHSAVEAAAIKIIKATPNDSHPVRLINRRNLVVLRIGSLSPKRVTALGVEGRIYVALRGRILEDSKFEPTAETLKTGFAIFSARNEQVLMRIATLRPSLAYFN